MSTLFSWKEKFCPSLNWNKNQKLSKVINLNFVGIPLGVQKGGVYIVANDKLFLKSIEIENSKVEIDISNLDIGEFIKVKDLSIPSDFISNDEDQVLVVCRSPFPNDPTLVKWRPFRRKGTRKKGISSIQVPPEITIKKLMPRTLEFSWV